MKKTKLAAAGLSFFSSFFSGIPAALLVAVVLCLLRSWKEG